MVAHVSLTLPIKRFAAMVTHTVPAHTVTTNLPAVFISWKLPWGKHPITTSSRDLNPIHLARSSRWEKRICQREETYWQTDARGYKRTISRNLMAFRRKWDQYLLPEISAFTGQPREWGKLTAAHSLSPCKTCRHTRLIFIRSPLSTPPK